MTTKCMGMDISLNHGAVVELTDGEQTGFWYYTDKAGSASKSKARGFRVPPKGTHDERQQYMMERLFWVEEWIDTLLTARSPTHVGIEDYAIRAEQGAHYLGEVGALARRACWVQGLALRLHDPISAKMFVTHDGTAQKDLVEEFVQARWGSDYSKFNPNPPQNPKHKQNRQTSEDLADAEGLAQLVWAEVRIRSGDLLLKELEHDKERQVFNRVTKTYPVSLLDRSWIQNPRGATDMLAPLEGKVSPKALRIIRKLLQCPSPTT